MARWKENVRKLKLARHFMKRAMHGIARNEVGMAFRRWKNSHNTDI